MASLLGIVTTIIDNRKAKGIAFVARKLLDFLPNLESEYDITLIHHEPTKDPLYKKMERDIDSPSPLTIRQANTERNCFLDSTAPDRKYLRYHPLLQLIQILPNTPDLIYSKSLQASASHSRTFYQSAGLILTRISCAWLKHTKSFPMML